MSSLHVRSGNAGSVQVVGSDRLIQGLWQSIADQNAQNKMRKRFKMMSFLIIFGASQPIAALGHPNVANLVAQSFKTRVFQLSDPGMVDQFRLLDPVDG